MFCFDNDRLRFSKETKIVEIRLNEGDLCLFLWLSLLLAEDLNEREEELIKDDDVCFFA